jgi:hypothetical protein
LPTTCQRDDGAVFRDDLNRTLDLAFKRTTDLDDQFRAKFQGALLSPLVMKRLKPWHSIGISKISSTKIKDRDLSRRLEDIQEELPEQVIKIDDKLRELVDSGSDTSGLPDEVRQMTREMTADFREYVRERIKTQVEALLRIFEELKALMIPANLDHDLNREELESMLNS